MIPDFTWRHGDQTPSFQQQLAYSDGTAPNFTGATVSLLMRSLASSAPVTLDAQATVVEGHPDTLQWTPDATDAEAIEPGDYLANWITVTGGVPMSWPTTGQLWIRVEASLTDVELTMGSRPSNQQVAALLRARTRDRGGKEWGKFIDGTTRPGATEVEGLIDEGIAEILTNIVGIDYTAVPGTAYNAPGSNYETLIRSAVAFYTASLVEASYMPEQAANRGSTLAPYYMQLYNKRLKALIAYDKEGEANGEGDGGNGSNDSPADAAYSFPANNGGLIGWNTQW